jgi:hypothetical protein
MTDRSKDELADALARLSAGDVDPSEASHHDEPVPPPAPPAAPAPKSAAPKAAPARPSAAPAKPTARPPAPGQPSPASAKRPAPPNPARPAGPPGTPPSPSPARPAAPVRPATPAAQRPTTTAATRSARPSVPGLVTPAATAPSRPAVPTAPPPPPIVQPVPLEEPAAEEAPSAEADDDAVIVPAAPQEYLGHTPVRPHRHKARAQKLDYDSLKFRQTSIPIFLTTGVMLFLAGALRFIVGTDAPLSDLPLWLAFTTWIAAAFMIGGAVMNMMRVRNQLERAANGDESK